MSEEIDRIIRSVRDSKALAKLIGEAPTFLRVVSTIPKIARHGGTVLITGETGTGKELIARAIHYSSDRAGRSFVCVNCGSLPDSLAEDALFGHEAGAFTDARVARRGLFAEAEGGSLFLDEVEALSPRVQAVLLRVLQDGTFHALGSARQVRSDVRIVAATNSPLDELVRAGRFRSDLYYRLRVFCLDLPPLRERKGDPLLLAAHFLRVHTPADTPPAELSAGAKAALDNYEWPGNIRELEYAILRAVVVCRTGVIGVEDLGLPVGEVTSEPRSATVGRLSYQMLKREKIASFERTYLTELMAQHGGNITRAARTAGKDRREFGKLLKKYGVDPQDFRVA